MTVAGKEVKIPGSADYLWQLCGNEFLTEKCENGVWILCTALSSCKAAGKLIGSVWQSVAAGLNCISGMAPTDTPAGTLCEHCPNSGKLF